MIHVNHRCQAKLVAVGLCFALFLALPSRGEGADACTAPSLET